MKYVDGFKNRMWSGSTYYTCRYYTGPILNRLCLREIRVVTVLFPPAWHYHRGIIRCSLGLDGRRTHALLSEYGDFASCSAGTKQYILSYVSFVSITLSRYWNSSLTSGCNALQSNEINWQFRTFLILLVDQRDLLLFVDHAMTGIAKSHFNAWRCAIKYGMVFSYQRPMIACIGDQCGAFPSSETHWFRPQMAPFIKYTETIVLCDGVHNT